MAENNVSLLSKAQLIKLLRLFECEEQQYTLLENDYFPNLSTYGPPLEGFTEYPSFP